MKPLRYSTQQISEDDIAAVVAVLRSDWLTQGPAVEAFEGALAQYVGSRYAVAVSSGTAALELAYRASGADGIATSPLSFVATASAARHAGLSVGFMDVEVATGNVAVGEEPKWCAYDKIIKPAFVPVHFAGRAATVDGSGARYVIEDACHALGAWDFDGCSRVGSCAHSLAACFSFHPVKPITTGEGGAVTTSDEGFARELRMLRNHGRDGNGLMVRLGGNYRMTDMQAALGLSQLKRCDEMRKRRCELANLYCAEMHEYHEPVGPSGAVAVRGCSHGGADIEKCWHAHHLFPVRIKDGRRDEVRAKLNAQGIGVQVHYDPPIHLHPYWRARGFNPGDFPEAEAWSKEELSLPLHAGMSEADVVRVVDALGEALA